MDVEAARDELIRALNADASADRGSTRFRAARDVLIDRGTQALDLTESPGRSLDTIVEIASTATMTPSLRAFAVLLVHALGTDGLLPSRGKAEDQLRSFLERALLNPLRRADYPFDGSAYDKRQALARLHATIQEHLRPPEPSIPRWIHGLDPSDQA